MPQTGFIPTSPEAFLDPAHTALVMWDWQKGLAGKALGVERIRTAAQRLVAAADAAGVPVLWSRHVLPPLDLISGPFKLFLMQKQRVSRPEDLAPAMQEGMEETAFLDGLAPAAHHLVFEKSQPSLFIDTPVDLRLKTMGIRTLVLTGVATDIGLEFTARHAAALGYFSTIAEDATGSYSEAAQAGSMAFFRRWITPVMQSDEIIRHWA